MPTGTITLAGIQFAGLQKDKERNLEVAEKMIIQAARKGAQILVTPEVVLTGFIGGADERRLAEPIPGPTTAYLGALARQFEVHILFGMSELRNGQIYNAVAVIGRDGNLMGVMRKVHINKHETWQQWRNGSEFPVWKFQTDTGEMTAGIMICYDREVPESARILMLQDVDVIFNPLACYCPTEDIHRCLLRARAFENEVEILVVNHAEPRFNGHSMYIDYRGVIKHELGSSQDILLVTVELDKLSAYRQQGIYGKHHRRPELYQRLMDAAGQIHPSDANLPT